MLVRYNVTYEHVKSHDDVENDIAVAQFAGNEGEPHILFASVQRGVAGGMVNCRW